MRADAIGPRTWMLGAVAAWAVLAWVLALFGLGGRIGSLPDDPSLAAELPQWRTPAGERLAPLAQYAAVGEHPLFDEERRARPFYIEGSGSGEATSAADLVLSGVLITPGLQMAFVQRGDNGPAVRLKLGEANPELPGWRLAELAPRSAVLEGSGGRRTLELRVYAGSGGEAPTVIGAVPPASAANAPDAAPLPVPGANPAGAASAQTAPPKPASSAPQPASEAPLTSEQQMQAIRQRIEARRRQLREQQQQQPTQAKPR